MRRKRAFTLVELLVVMAIIAVLISVLMPALNSARELATGAVCLSRQKGLSTAWFLYQEDNDGHFCEGHDHLDYYSYYDPPFYQWVRTHPPGSDYSLEIEKEYIQMGVLYPYAESIDLYNCPGDHRSRHEDRAYRSYSVSYSLGDPLDRRNGEDAGFLYPAGEAPPSKYTQIPSPAGKFVFIEEADPRSVNRGTWIMRFVERAWIDPIAVWHNTKSTFGFADGHAEMHQWLDEQTINMGEDQELHWQSGLAAGNSPDFLWVRTAYNVW